MATLPQEPLHKLLVQIKRCSLLETPKTS